MRSVGAPGGGKALVGACGGSGRGSGPPGGLWPLAARAAGEPLRTPWLGPEPSRPSKGGGDPAAFLSPAASAIVRLSCTSGLSLRLSLGAQAFRSV